MRAVFEYVVPTAPLSWKLFARREARFDFQWHFHHEYELTLIVRGNGTRIVGDCVQPYGPGDLTLIGPEMPHTYVSTPGQVGRVGPVGPVGQEAVVAQFRRDFLGPDLFDRPEFADVARLLERAARGLHFPSRSAAPAERVEPAGPGGRTEPFDPTGLTALPTLPPPERTLALLRLLVDLSTREPAIPLAGARHVPALNRASGDRVDAIVRLLHACYTRPIGLDEIAGAAHMSPTSVSRFFRRTTGMTLTDYLNRLRIEVACHLLRDTDRRIADIAADCGYANLANFNRRFRQFKGLPPREYRAGFRTP
ncbi:AraC family transcriptional regulator [Streptomyces sp. NBC_00669]|uniref:AraC family transcriptional regulator n=1 Tax=Streptomyces sp. NBC_00669 TaxID=2976011 RepID=UPI002E2F2F40|nr:AraC family transcriptional regulator [Streptomyces sp. NBC_00669]